MFLEHCCTRDGGVYLCGAGVSELSALKAVEEGNAALSLSVMWENGIKLLLVWTFVLFF